MTGIGFYMVYQIETSGHVIYRMFVTALCSPLTKEER